MTVKNLQNEQVIQAYQNIGQEVMAFIGGRTWDEAGAKYGIFGKMISSEWWYKDGSKINQIGASNIPDEISDAAQASIYYLRKHLLELTGDRIWGLTFTLYPTGKFNIDYDYTKPANYEETNDIIDGHEINNIFLK